MKFPYSGFLSKAQDSGEEIIIFRPEVPLRIHGNRGLVDIIALVDTGADNTILPLAIARELGIETRKAKGPVAVAFGGQQIPLSFADVKLELLAQDEALLWQARVQFFDFADVDSETLIVGHEGFLDFFTAIFDGEQTTLTLEPNNDIPRITQIASSR
jgi:hypothetical protein